MLAQKLTAHKSSEFHLRETSTGDLHTLGSHTHRGDSPPGGCGIPADKLARVTEPFYMVDKSRARKQGGSGMGLALCQRIAAVHGGTLQISSQVGVGTAVTVTLPKEVQP